LTANRAYHFLKYADKVFALKEALKSLHDGREWCHVPLESVLTSLLLGLVCQRGSLNRIEESVRNGVFDKALGKVAKPSADTMGYTLKRMDPEELREYNSSIVQKARYNKVFSKGTVDGLVVAAVDGTEVYSTKAESRSCRRCSVRARDGVKEYYEREVAVSYVGNGPALVIGMRRQEKGEGELTAAIALMEYLYWHNTRFCDVIVADALYAAAPFINEATSQGKWVVIRAKRQDYRVLQDANGLFAHRKPDFEKTGIEEFKGSTYDVRIWDEEDFTSWDGVEGPVRCLKVEETRNFIKNGAPVAEQTTTHIVTTCPKALVKAMTIWKIMHKRWGIENSVFHEAKTCCSFDHSFIHHDVGTEVLRMLQVIALNLFLLFRWRSLRRKHWTYRGLGEAILLGLVTLPGPFLAPSG